MSAVGLRLVALPGRYAVHRFPPDAPLPDFPADSRFLAITRSPTELSVVLDAERELRSSRCETDFVCFQVDGTLDFSLVGVLAELTAHLADAGVPVLAISSFDTDFLLVRAPDRDAARNAWQAAGHIVRDA